MPLSQSMCSPGASSLKSEKSVIVSDFLLPPGSSGRSFVMPILLNWLVIGYRHGMMMAMVGAMIGIFVGCRRWGDEREIDLSTKNSLCH